MTTQDQKIPVGYKQTEVGVIPTDWEVKKLGDICEIYQPQTISQNNFSERWYPVYWANWVVWYYYEYNHATRQNTITCRGSTCWTINKSVDKSWITGNAMVMNVDKNWLIDKDFFYHLLMKQDFKNCITWSGQPQIVRRPLFEFQVNIPKTKEEQTLIATVLSDIDELITQMDGLIAKKKAIKQWALQSLLTPKKDWEVKKLGEVCDIKKWQLITESTRIDWDIPVIAWGKTPAYYHNKPNRFGKTITISGSWASAGYVAFHDYPIFASDCSTIEESNKYSVEFIHCTLQLLQEKIYKMQTGWAQPHIYPSDLNPIEIGIPKSKDEQTHIATILSDIDNEIQQLEQKKSKYEQIKQWAMQQLLTGKIRLLNK